MMKLKIFQGFIFLLSLLCELLLIKYSIVNSISTAYLEFFVFYPILFLELALLVLSLLTKKEKGKGIILISGLILLLIQILFLFKYCF
jgi:hypothetical protein